MSGGSDTSWIMMPGDLRVSHDCVDVWRVPLDVDVDRVTGLRELLSDDERERADRFKFDDKRGEFTVARASLRRVLGVLLDEDPARLRFTYSALGKPTLDPARPDAEGHALEFNVSHTTGVALIAVTAGRSVGVDIESLERQVEHAALARRYFAPTEASALDAITDDAERHAAFFRCWTRKEAYVKAHGGGVAGGLDHFEVTLGADEPAALRVTHHDPAEASRWWLADVPVGGRYVAAAAAARRLGESLRLRTWESP